MSIVPLSTYTTFGLKRLDDGEVLGSIGEGSTRNVGKLENGTGREDTG